MKRLLSNFVGAAALAVLVLAPLGGCNKPTEENCRKALSNMQHLMGTENLRDEASLEGEVRRCKGGSKKQAVDCAIKAQTLDELRHCDFYKVPANLLPTPGGGPTPAGSGATGSAAGSAAMTGSAATSGSDAMAGSGAMTGSATMAGSAAPSGSGAMAGSATMAGSAAKSGAGSASGTTTGSAGSAAK